MHINQLTMIATKLNTIEEYDKTNNIKGTLKSSKCIGGGQKSINPLIQDRTIFGKSIEKLAFFRFLF